MALRPENDQCKIRLDDNDPFGYGGKQVDTADSGVLVELPDLFNFFGFHSFAFEDSFMAEDKLKKLHAYYKKKIGHRVWWSAMSERGNVIKAEDGKRYAFIKLTDIIASDDNPDSQATNLRSEGAGSFQVDPN